MADIKEKAALSSIVASACLAAAKFTAALTSGSLALLSDALHSLLDVGATILTYFAIKIGARPADERHPYGHGKVEAVSALIETGLLFVVALYIAFEAISRLWTGGHEVPPSILAFVVLIVSIIVDYFRSRTLLRIARETKSQALEADALHFSSDLVSSILVLLGLIASAYGYPQGDLVAAVGLSAYIGFAGYRLGKRTIDTLMDAVPKGLSERVREIVLAADGVAAIDNVRVRVVGPEIFAEVGIGVARTLAQDRVTAIKEGVVSALRAEYPGASVVVTTTPRALDDETILERVLHVAAVMRRPVHHVTIQHVGEKLSVSLDLEVDGRLRLADGHAIASQLETAIEDELGAGVEVEVHLEPLEVQALDGAPVPEAEAQQISDVLVAQARNDPVISNIHFVRVRRTAGGLVCNYHCYVDPDRSIHEVHEHIDAFDREVRRRIPHIMRLVSHAEPRPAR